MKKNKKSLIGSLYFKSSFRLIIVLLTSTFLFQINAQTIAKTGTKISGIVFDETNLPIIGANVRMESTKTGTITDNDGKFTLNGTLNSELIISYIGYETKRLDIKNQSFLRVTLQPSSKDISEVVVVGYASQKKASVVGAISQIKGADLMKAGVPSVANALSGKIPGLVTIQQSGQPGSNDSKIYIRGLSTIGSSSQTPLILVDGIERSMSDMDPSDIETISVLKDASATAVFGVKGANGVIMITTKRGQEGKMEISASYDYIVKSATSSGIQENSYLTKSALNNQYRNLNQFNNVVSDEVLNHYLTQDMPYIYPDVDSWNLNVKDYTSDQRLTISARGGTKKARYYISLGYLNETDLLKSYQTLYDPSYSYNRYTYRLNFDFDITKTTKLSISGGGYLGMSSQGGGNQANVSKFLNDAYVMPPYITPYFYPQSFIDQYPDPRYPNTGERISYSGGGFWQRNTQGTLKQERDMIGTDVVLKQNLDMITKGLNFQGSLSYNNQTSWQGGGYESYNGESYTFELTANGGYQWKRYVGTNQDDYSPVVPLTQAVLRHFGQIPSMNYVYSGQFNYARSFGNHNVSALASIKRRISQSGANFQHFEEDWVGRATYDYLGKYLFEVNVGVSGSEQFSPEKRFGTFPALALGWNVAREEFFKKAIPAVSTMKFRYSYGESGSDGGLSGFLYLSSFANSTGYSTGTNLTSLPVSTLAESKVPNYDATWERAKKHNIGFDFGALEDRLTLTVELFSENRDHILIPRTIPSWFGQTVQNQNVGAVKKHGYEFDLGYRDKVGELNYWVKLNFNYNENRILNQDEPLLTPDNMKLAGKPISAIISQPNYGYYQNMDEMMNYSLNNLTFNGTTNVANTGFILGADKLLDYNGNGLVEWDKDAVANKYSTNPNASFGFSGGFDYRNFDFSFMVQGASLYARNFWRYTVPLMDFGGGRPILYKDHSDTWTPDNPNAAYAAWGGFSHSSKGVTDGSYIRLKNIEIGYNLKGKILKSIGLSSARLSLNGANLLTYAPGYFIGDPENQANTDSYGVVSYGYYSYPIPKLYTLALKVNF